MPLSITNHPNLPIVCVCLVCFKHQWQARGHLVAALDPLGIDRESLSERPPVTLPSKTVVRNYFDYIGMGNASGSRFHSGRFIVQGSLY